MTNEERLEHIMGSLDILAVLAVFWTAVILLRCFAHTQCGRFGNDNVQVPRSNHGFNR